MEKDLLNDISHLLGSSTPQPVWRTTFASAAAGLVVDTSLYPIDTIKSRLQSNLGFIKSGGFSNIYRGFPPVLIGSIPSATLFFVSYEWVKNNLHQYEVFKPNTKGDIVNQAVAASVGEVASCIVRVPYDVIKVRSQTSAAKKVSNIAIMREIITKESIVGLYRGFLITLARDLPFSAIQLPLWEKLKDYHLDRHHRHVNAIESAWYGCIAGGIAAFFTTPIDVARTRIMLADKAESLASGNILPAMKSVYVKKGVQGLFAGVIPRIVFTSLGAAIFLGTYEKSIKVLMYYPNTPQL